ncbi:cbb3-type cytochrome c oxidase subunit 3 [Kiloniella sp. b19]|uniref:cbb3-type cytochrome c oxidase subunit 3 n=1 Tax=Kiloniella sp. GXU_MW_B19 TaxID=3141326 RepID=UPI0031D9A698
MTEFEAAITFTKSWGLVYLVVLFVGFAGYAFWPRNKKKFDDASHIPLKED